MSDNNKFYIAYFSRNSIPGMISFRSNRNGYFDSDQLLTGARSIGCICGLTGTASGRTYYYVIYIFTAIQSNMPPRMLFERTDTWATWNAPTGSNGSITYDGVTYYYAHCGGWYKDNATGKLYQYGDNYELVDFTFDPNGGAKLHDIGDYDTSYISNAIITDTIEYLLNEQPSSGGQGTATLTLKPPAQLLTFESLLYGKSIQKWVSGDCEVNFTDYKKAIDVEQLTARHNWAGGGRLWDETLTTLQLDASDNLRLILINVKSPIQSDGRFYLTTTWGARESRLFPTLYGVGVSSSTFVNQRSTDLSILVKGFGGDYYYGTFAFDIYTTIITFIGISTITYNISISKYMSSYTDVLAATQIFEAGIYLIQFDFDVQSNDEFTKAYIKDTDNNILSSYAAYDSQGYQGIELCSLVELDEETTLSFYVRSTTSANIGGNVRALKVNGTLFYATFTSVTAQSLITVGAMNNLQPGRYIVSVEASYDIGNLRWYLELTDGTTVYATDTGFSNSNYPTANFMCYVLLTSTTTLYVKSNNNVTSASISGKIKALKL